MKKKPKLRFGLRSLVILVYSALFTAGVVTITAYQDSRRVELSAEISSLHLNEFMAEVVETQPEQAHKARDILNQLNEIKAAVEVSNRQTRVYSVFYLILVSIVSLTLFLWVIYTLTSPLEKFSQAIAEISKGNFNIRLREKGTWELREAQRSFNLMSQQLHKTQKKLLEAEKDSIWKQFSRMLAHEIKNPLTPIRLSVERLMEKKGTERFDKVFDRSMLIINQEVDNLQNLAKNFSNFAKDVPVTPQNFYIKKETSSIIRSYEDRIDIKIHGDDFMISFDRMHFYQILTNIIQNAIDAAGTEEKIIIEIDKKNNYIKIQDHGPGIEEEHLKKIFEPYFTRKRKGIGLGLALVKKLVNINGAEIKVQSKVGEGTVFIIIFGHENEAKEETSDADNDN